MNKPVTGVAQQVAEAVGEFEQRRTGHSPKSMTVVVTKDTLVITLHGVLSEAEKAVGRNATGAAQVKEFHRQLFANSSDWLREEITRITGVPVREATAEVATATGTMVQVFLLAESVPADTWSSN